MQPGFWGPYTGRIMQLVVKVDHLNGEYAFTNSKEYPAPKEMDMEMPIHLGVDFASATRMLDGNGESHTFTDEATGVAVTVQTTDSHVAGVLGTAKLSVTELTQGSAYAAAKTTIVHEYVDEPGFKLYDLHLLTAEGEEIVPTWSEALAVSLPLGDGVTNGEVVSIANGSANKINVAIDNGFASFEGMTSLGQFAVVDTASIPPWIHTTVIDPATGIMLRAYSINQVAAGMFNELTKPMVDLLASKKTEGEYLTAALKGLAGDTSLRNPVVKASYQIGIVHTIYLGDIDGYDDLFKDEGASWRVWRGLNDAFAQAILPVSDNGVLYYLITNDGEHATAVKLNATIENGMTTIDLMPRSLSKEAGKARLNSLYWGQREVPATTTRPISYVVAVKNNPDQTPGGNIPGTKTVTANLYVPGSLNTQLPGITAYLTNGSNPQGIGGYPKKAPTQPVSDNAQLTTSPDGKMTLVLNIPNPVFTLQQIDGSSNAKILSVQRDSGTYGSYTGRITQITVELLDNSGTYVFANCVEYPTLLGVNWYVPLTLSVQFSGGSSGLPSQGDVDVGDLGNLPDGKGPTDKDGGTAAKVTLTDGTEVTTITWEDGSSVVSMATLKGSTSETTVDANGRMKASVALSEQETAGLKAGTALLLPIPDAIITNRLETAPTIKLTSLGADDVASLLVSVPTSGATPGTIVVMIKEDGTAEAVAGTKYNNGTLIFTAEKNVTYKLVDNSKSFPDVSGNNWYTGAVQYMSAREWIQGTNNGFEPDGSTSRGMIVTILHRMAGSPPVSAGSPAFADVTAGKYYADAAAWASERAIASGYGDGTFGANDPVTREQLAVMLWRYAGTPASSGGLVGFTDQDQASGFADKALAWAVELGILSGKGNGILDPKGQATRAQTAQILMNFMEKLSIVQ